ncbi:hypothetical protein [Haloflavibacter putidus]|uniref:Lipocalin-like domain-containing protein n=1 Tax=Haloflavibacter putidus TaxID=2576776 RepID=A0A507ZS87_9FLAO|nr:hypothetical protein [Haloflavibacter putidus]TQD39134.1 hypothetical protein FKR84_07000 [Haloflavibacter putidus]
MKNILLAIILLPLLTYCQSSKTYLELVDDAKTKKNAEQIEKLIIGTWEFQKLTDKNGKTIAEVKHFVNDTITATEYVSRPNMRIEKDKTYEIFGCENAENCEIGAWEYDSKAKIFRMTFDKPKYKVPIDRIAPGLLEQLKKSGSLIEFTKNEIEIAEITQTELKVFEFLESDGTELKYNLKVYRKK